MKPNMEAFRKAAKARDALRSYYSHTPGYIGADVVLTDQGPVVRIRFEERVANMLAVNEFDGVPVEVATVSL